MCAELEHEGYSRREQWVSDKIPNISKDGTEFVDKMHKRIFISKSLQEISRNSIGI